MMYSYFVFNYYSRKYFITFFIISYTFHHTFFFFFSIHLIHILCFVFGRALLNTVVSGALATAVAWFIPKSSQ